MAIEVCLGRGRLTDLALGLVSGGAPSGCPGRCVSVLMIREFAGSWLSQRGCWRQEVLQVVETAAENAQAPSAGQLEGTSCWTESTG